MKTMARKPGLPAPVDAVPDRRHSAVVIDKTQSPPINRETYIVAGLIKNA